MKCLPDLEGWAKGVREEKRRRVMMMWQQLESMIQKKQDDCETDLGKKQDTSTVCLELINDVKLVWVVMRENQDNEDEIFIKETSSADDAVFIASVYERIRKVMSRLDGHQGRDAAEYVCDTMFDRIAGTLLTNPEDIQTEIKTVLRCR